jgi:hypothetical protein
MNDIKSLYDAAVNYNNATIHVDGIEIKLFISWNVGAESYILRVNNKIIHTTKRAGIKKILAEWMEGKMKLENGSLVKC